MNQSHEKSGALHTPAPPFSRPCHCSCWWPCSCLYRSLGHTCLQVTKMMKSQGSMVAEDRRVLLAEQNASMERLVNSISATVNRDLPLRMEEIVRAEVHSTSTALTCIAAPWICINPAMQPFSAVLRQPSCWKLLWNTHDLCQGCHEQHSFVCTF